MNYIIENTKKLLSTIAQDKNLEKEDIIYMHNFIIENVLCFSNYVTATNEHVYTICSISELRKNNIISQDEFEYKLKTIDTTRRLKHNKAIDSCNQLNRLCDRYNLPHICQIDTTDRYAVANFAAQFAMASHGYALSHNYTMDEVITMLENDPNMLKNKTIFEEYDEI